MKDMKSYRPISNRFISKIFEILLATPIKEQLTYIDLNDSYQFARCRGQSNETLLLKVCSDIAQVLDNFRYNW